MLNTNFTNHGQTISTQRLNSMFTHKVVVLRYNVGPFGYWLIRRLCMFHCVSYDSVLCFRISDDNDTWALIINPTVDVKPFIDLPILP